VAHVFGHDARHHIASTARRKRHDYRDRSRRISLRMAASGSPLAAKTAQANRLGNFSMEDKSRFSSFLTLMAIWLKRRTPPSRSSRPLLLAPLQEYGTTHRDPPGSAAYLFRLPQEGLEIAV
jgi:hypothetical protein